MSDEAERWGRFYAGGNVLHCRVVPYLVISRRGQCLRRPSALGLVGLEMGQFSFDESGQLSESGGGLAVIIWADDVPIIAAGHRMAPIQFNRGVVSRAFNGR